MEVRQARTRGSLWRLILAVLVTLSSHVLATAPNVCPSALWSATNGRCYTLASTQALSITTARSYCLNQGAQLVSVITSAEQTAALSSCRAGGSSADCWLGATRVGSSQAFSWDTGASYLYTSSWASGNPVACGGTCDTCVRMNRSDGRWVTIPCTATSTGLTVPCVQEALCPAGTARTSTYNFATGARGSCTTCIAGRYSSAVGSTSCLQCDAGRYGSAGATSSACTGPCKLGSYCPVGTALGSEVRCPPGTYNDQFGATSVSDCLPCAAGYQCPNTASGAIDEFGSLARTPPATPTPSPCPVGRCSNAGASSCIVCPSGYFCPTLGTACPGLECGFGNYCQGTGRSTAVVIPLGARAINPAVIGSNTTFTGVTNCPAGNYCRQGFPIICPNGTYATGTSYRDTCLACSAGYFCPEGSTNSRPRDCAPTRNVTIMPDLAKYYCPAGTPQILEAPYGYYTTPTSTNAWNRWNVTFCPPNGNLFCTNGTAYNIMNTNRCGTFNVNEGNGCSLQNPAIGPSSCPLENTSFVWSNFNFTLNPLFSDFPMRVQWNSNYSFSASTSPNCRPLGGGFAKNEDLFFMNNYFPTYGSIQFRRRGFRFGLNYEVCLESRTRTAYTLPLTYSTEGVDPFNGDYRNITFTCNVVIQVVNQNEPPYFDFSTKYLQIKEKAVEGSPLNQCNQEGINAGCPACSPLVPDSCADDNTILAKDPDFFSSFTHFIKENDTETDRELAVNGTENENWKFDIEPCSGRMSVRNSAPLRYADIVAQPNGARRVLYRVGARDQFDWPSATYVDVFVYVINVNDPPILSSSDSFTFSIPENSPPGTAFNPAQPTYYDEDNDTCTFFDAVDFIPYEGLLNGRLYFSFNADSRLRVTTLGASVLDFENPVGSFAVTVTASDGNGGFDTETYPIVVTDANDPPVFTSTGPFTILENRVGDVCSATTSSGVCGSNSARVTSDDQDTSAWPSDITTYVLSDDAAGRFTIDLLTGQISATVSLDYENTPLLGVIGQLLRGYTIKVTASSPGHALDPNLRTTTVSVQIIVINLNEPPEFTRNPVIYTALETHPVGVQLTAITAFVVDPDNVNLQPGESPNPLTFSMNPTQFPGSASSKFSIVNGPAVNVVNVVLTQPLDFETTPLCGFDAVRRCLVFVIRAFDGLSTISGNITVEVLDINEPPFYPGGATLGSVNITENTYVGGPSVNLSYPGSVFLAQDPDIFRSPFVYLIYDVVGGTGSQYFEVVNLVSGSVNSGQTHFYIRTKPNMVGTNFNFESGVTRYTLSVRVRDTGSSSYIGKSCDFASDCGADATCSNKRCSERCYSESGSVPRQVGPERDYFCNYTGVNQTQFPYESTLGTVSVNILDANDPPFLIGVTQSTPFCRWNSSVVFTNTTTTRDLIAFNSMFDSTRDEDPIDTTFSYTIDSSFVPVSVGYKADLWAGGGFTLDATTGRIMLPTGSSSLSAYAIGDDLAGRVTIADTRGANSSCIMVVALTDFNFIPELSANASITIPENSPPGVFVAQAVANDPGDTLVYSIPANPNFVINATTGVITTSSTVSLDFEKQPVYIILVRVRDSKNAETTAPYTITLIDVDDPPTFVNMPSLVSFPEVTGANYVVISNLTDFVSDQDAGDTVTFSLPDCTGNQTCPFVINTITGRISIFSGFIGVTDFEGPTNSWRISVRATDSKNLSAIVVLTLSLLDVNEPPVFTSSAFNITTVENILAASIFDFGAVSSDPDVGDVRNFTIVSGNSLGYFRLTSTGTFGLLTALDYEDVNQFNLVVRVSDKLGLNNTATVTVYVDNVNDLTITSVLPATLPSCSTPTVVTINGTNFGMKNPTLAQIAVVRGRYRSASMSLDYISPSCNVTIPNSQIMCLTAPGVGGDLVWTINVTVPSDPKLQNQTITGQLSTAMNYPVPAITGISAGTQNLRTSGGELFQVFGTCLGTASDLITFSPSALGRNFVEMCNTRGTCVNPTCSYTGANLTCISAPGLGRSLSLQVRIGGRISAIAPNMASYARPTVVAVNTPVVSTLGTMPYVACCTICPTGYIPCGDNCLAPGANACDISQGCACRSTFDTQSIIINGTNFGPLGSVPDSVVARLSFIDSSTDLNATIDRVLSNCVVTRPFLEVSCASIAPGAGYLMPILISFGDQVSTSTAALISYERPKASVMAGPFNRATTQGGQVIEIRGLNFGPVCGGSSTTTLLDPCPYVKASYTAFSRNPVTGELIIYEPPCRVVSQTLVFCLTLPGTGANLLWTMNVGNQAVQDIQTFVGAYAPPVVGAYSGAGALNALTVGGQEILLLGSQFGPIGGAAIIAQYGLNPSPEFLASNCTVVNANEMIRCTTGPGAGTDLKWFVVVDGQSSVNAQTNYATPVITSVTGPGVNSSSDGGEEVFLDGINFGPRIAPGPYLDRIVYGPTSFPFAYEASCSIVIAHTRIRCLTAPGVGFNMQWQVTIRGQTSVASTDVTNYKLPFLVALSQNRSGTQGGTQIRLTGLNMALCDAQSTPLVTFGSLNIDVSNRRMGISPNTVPLVCPTPNTTENQNKEVTFVVPEMTFARTIQIGYVLRSARLDYQTVSALNTLTFAYDDPVIFDVYAVPTVEVTRLRVTVSGRNFCNSELCCQTIFDGNPVALSDVEAHTHTAITFIIRSTGRVQIQCGEFITPPKPFTAEDPYIIATTPKLSDVTFNTQGGSQVIIWGLYFGLTNPLVYIGNRLAFVAGHESVTCDENLPSYADFASAGTTVYCWKTTIVVPAGEGKAELVTVQNGNQTSHFHSDDFEKLRYSPPVLSQSVSFSGSFGRRRQLTSTCCFKTDGSDLATLVFTGSDLGTQGTVWLGYVGNIPAIIVSWNHTQVVVRIPPGEGKDLQALFFSGDQQPLAGPPNVYISYAAPSISSVDRGVLPVPTIGGSIVTVIGQNFGRPFISECALNNCTTTAPLIQIIGNTITFCEAISGTQIGNTIKCTVPAGAGANLLVRMTVAGQFGERSNAFSYDPPVIDSITPQLVSTSGLDPVTGNPLVMTITGQNFGVTDLCVKIVDPRPGQPNFAIGVRAVTQPILFGCAQLDGTPPPALLSAPSHSVVQLYVPEFHGKNVRIIVVAGGQESIVGGNFSYISPLVTSVQILNKTWPSGAGRVIGNVAFGGLNQNATNSSNAVLSYGSWTNFGDSRVYCDSTTFYGMRGIGWRTDLDIDETGLFTRTILFFNSSTCDASRRLFRVQTTGKFSDIEAHPTLSCMRVFYEDLYSVTLLPITEEGLTALNTLQGCGCDTATYVTNSVQDVTQCFVAKLQATLEPGQQRECVMISNSILNGFGMYFISDSTKLFMSEHPLDSDIDATREKTTVSLPDLPTATVANLQSLDTPMGPTEGCYQFERQDAFLARLAIAQRSGGTTTRLCDQPAYMILTGSNFGVSKPTLASGLRVLLVSSETGVTYEASTTSRGGDAGALCTTCSHTHNKLVVQIPPGAGRNLYIKVEIGLGEYTQTSQSPWPLFHYSPPFILESVPGTVSRAKGFLNAEGESVLMRGYNFGGKPSNVTILINGKVCTSSGWVSGDNDIDGTPFLTCTSIRDVVGPKAVMVCVAGQATMNVVARDDAVKIKKGQSLGIWAAGISAPSALTFAATISSTINTQCKSTSNGTKFYADMYGLCQLCPTGSNCDILPETRFGPPPAAETYFRFAYPTWDMATQSVPLRAQQRCAREVWDQTNLTVEHPSAVVSEVCFDYVRCTPPESCAGSNTCSTGYQYALDECIKYHGSPIQPLANTSVVPKFIYNTIQNQTICGVSLDIYTGEWKGNNLDCNPTGKTCRPGSPQYCSECTVLFREADNSTDDPIPFGYCKCVEPERCAFCTLFKYFRLQGECKKCPDNPALLIAMFFVIAALCIVGGYYLQKKNFNLAFISIGVDYFQVLALFSSTNVEWPAIIQEVFQIMSLLNFNIDITAPECLVPTLEYDFKWYLMEAIPLMMMALLITIHFSYVGYKLYFKGHRADLYSHVSRLYAVFFTALYYLYINITKKALDIFNCNPADPDDGYFYASFTSLSCEGSVCRCGEGLQASLIPWAILALVFYTIGFPAFIASRLLRYRYEILEDQYLRANGIGESRLTNPNAYDVRKRYSKLYFHFRPEYNYWILVILARKFGIVFAGLMFRGNTGFQLAVVLLVLFVSYVLQVTNRPYMSTGEREKVKDYLDVFVKKAMSNVKYSWYPEIQQNVLEARRRFLKKKRKQLMVRFDPKGEKEDHIKREATEEPQDGYKDMELKRSSTNYFFDYNTVEATLLACAVLISLIGVMFESGRFNLNRPDLKGQEDFLAWAVIIIVFGSIIYYFIVFFGEMWQITGSNRCLRLFMRKKKDEKVTNEDIDDTVILDTNPLLAQLASSPFDIKAKQDEMVDALRRAGEQNDQLKTELMAERKRAAMELNRFETLVKKGLVQETEEDRLDDGEDMPSSTGSFVGRKTLTSRTKGRGKGGMSDFLKGKTVSAGAALEQDRHMRAGRPTVSKELGANTQLKEAYKSSISHSGDDLATGNPIYQAERSVFQDGGSGTFSLRGSLVSLSDSIRRKTLGAKKGDDATDDNEG